MSCGVPIIRPARTPREDYEADRRDLSPEWSELGEATRQAYEKGAPRWKDGHGVGAAVGWKGKP